jgi:hypothetical protein
MITPYHLVDAVPAAFFGIVAIWASGSRLHWFLRTAVVGGVLLALLLIPAHEIVIQFGVQVLIVVIVMAAWRRMRASRENRLADTTAQPAERRGWRLSLQTLLLLTAVIAVVTAVAGRLPRLAPLEWAAWTLHGIAASFATLFSLWVVLGKAHWAWRLAALPLQLVALGAVLNALRWIGSAFRSSPDGSWAGAKPYWDSIVSQGLLWNFYDNVAVVTVGELIVCVWVFLTVGAGWFHPLAIANHHLTRAKPRQARTAYRYAALSVFAAASLFPLYLFYRLLTPAAVPDLSAPRPNGYDELLAVGKELHDLKYGGTSAIASLSNTQSQQVITDNASSLAAVRVALQRDCRFPLVDNYTPKWMPDSDRSSLYKISDLLFTQCQFATRVGTLSDQLAANIDVLRFYFHELQGGGIHDDIRFVRYHEQAIDDLWQIKAQLTSEQRVELLELLQHFDANWPTWRELVDRQEIIDENSGWERHLHSMLEKWSGGSSMNQYDADLYQSRLIQIRLLILDLAIRQFQAQHGRPPSTLAELVPEQISRVPTDPFTNGAPLRYRVAADDYELYSVGRNGIDDGGEPKTRPIISKPKDWTAAVLFSAPIVSPAATTPGSDLDVEAESKPVELGK